MFSTLVIFFWQLLIQKHDISMILITKKSTISSCKPCVLICFCLYWYVVLTHPTALFISATVCVHVNSILLHHPSSSVTSGAKKGAPRQLSLAVICQAKHWPLWLSDNIEDISSGLVNTAEYWFRTLWIGLFLINCLLGLRNFRDKFSTLKKKNRSHRLTRNQVSEK